MNKKCLNCKLVNYKAASDCARCHAPLDLSDSPTPGYGLTERIGRRLATFITVCIATVAGFYASLIYSADSLDYKEKAKVDAAISILEDRGFIDEVVLLKTLVVFRSNDHWLNASVHKENAFAATNFPFEIVTLYPEFFSVPADDVERAAILLHEAKHLEGKDEREAYEFVWRNRSRLGWDAKKYGFTDVWLSVKKQTRDAVPDLFVCTALPDQDCTES
jgi:hypothetical protein